ncbi:MAG: GNAT family N-acetyltransferase [Propionicimonas sp.]
MSDLFAAYEPRAHGTSTAVAVELLSRHHLAAVVAIAVQREGGDAAAWLASLEASLSAPDEATFVALIGERVAGYARVGWLAPGTGDPSSAAPAAWYLLGLVVDPRLRRQGVGRELTAARLRWLGHRTERIWFFVSSENQASIDLHEEFGFRRAATDLRIPGVSFTGTGLLYAADVHRASRVGTKSDLAFCARKESSLSAPARAQ